MLFEQFDRELVRKLYRAVINGEDAVFHDPQYPYLLTLKPLGQAWEIKIEDTRKRWWGRTVRKKRTTSRPANGISMSQGPAFDALMELTFVLEADGH